MYHLTLESNIESILQRGLIPGIGDRSLEMGEAVKAVYLFDSVHDAHDALANWYGESVDDQAVVLLEVNTDDLVLYKVEFEYQCLDVIESKRIKILEIL